MKKTKAEAWRAAGKASPVVKYFLDVAMGAATPRCTLEERRSALELVEPT